MQAVLHTRGARLAATLLGATCLACLLAPLWCAALGVDPYSIDASAIEYGPSAAHWLGTDELGRDVLARLLYGGRTSIAIGLLAAALSGALGAGVGVLAAYYGGLLDAALMRATDALMAIPRFPLLVVLMSLDTGGVPGWAKVVLVVALLGWMDGARLARAVCLPIRRAGYVEAARAMGLSDARILRIHVLPNALGPLVVAAALDVGQVVLYESVLSFLGLGIAPPAPSWGAMLARGLLYVHDAPWLVIAPGLLTVATVGSINALADALRDARDPRL